MLYPAMISRGPFTSGAVYFLLNQGGDQARGSEKQQSSAEVDTLFQTGMNASIQHPPIQPTIQRKQDRSAVSLY
jgi:hypothetical protein